MRIKISKRINKSSEISNRKILVLLIIICIAAALIRFYLLEKGTFWLDETYSWERGRLTLAGLLNLFLDSNSSMILHYFLLHFWLYLGDSEFIIRSLSVIFGIASIPAIYFLGSKLFGKKAGLICSILLALHSFHVHYSQEARSYSLLVLLVILSSYFFIRAVESPKKTKFWVLYIVSSVLAVYSHTFVILILFAQLLSLNRKIILHITSKVLLKVIGFLILFILPLIVIMRLHSKGGGSSWIVQPTPEKLLEFFYQLTGNFGITLFLIYFILIFIAVLYFPSKITDSENSSRLKLYYKFLILWLAFPILTAYLVSLVKPIFVNRYLLMCLPSLILLASHGLVKLYYLRLGVFRIFPPALVLIVSLSSLGLNRYFFDKENNLNEWKNLATYLYSKQRLGDGIYLTHDCNPFHYHLKQRIKITNNRFLPEEIYPYPLTNVGNTVNGYKRILLISHVDKKYEEIEMIRMALNNNFQLQEKKVFEGFGINTGSTAIVSELYAKK
ncbi:MAG: hypothetical protein A2V93_01965 [Ignavibacteria bacterium RBG_16_34_14]|nr:MAG: hypothetical protein A2V93_01965 [Ignavibacteria bacterium RBG_16_34_14]